MSQPGERALEAVVISRLTWRLLPFLFLLYVVAYLDRINVGFAALEMQKQLGFSERVYGLGSGIFFVGYALLQVPSNLALTRVGARRWIAGIIVVWGLISSCMVFVTTPRSFYVLRFLLGAAEAGFFPGMILHLRNWFPVQARARAIALFVAAGPVSGIIGGPISGALLGVRAAGLAGWQWLFLLEGAPAIILGLVVLYALTDRPEEARWLSTREKKWLLEGLKDDHVRSGAIPQKLSSRQVIFAICGLTFIYFTIGACWYGLILWLPKMIKGVSGASNFFIGLMTVIPYLAAAVVMVYWGTRSDRSAEWRWHLAAPAFVGAVGFGLAALVSSTPATIAALTLAMLAVESTYGPFWAAATGSLKGTTAAVGVGVINSIGNLGGFFAPLMIGLVKTWTGSFAAALFMLAVFSALGGFLTLWVVPRTQASAGGIPLSTSLETPQC